MDVGFSLCLFRDKVTVTPGRRSARRCLGGACVHGRLAWRGSRAPRERPRNVSRQEISAGRWLHSTAMPSARDFFPRIFCSNCSQGCRAAAVPWFETLDAHRSRLGRKDTAAHKQRAPALGRGLPGAEPCSGVAAAAPSPGTPSAGSTQGQRAPPSPSVPVLAQELLCRGKGSATQLLLCVLLLTTEILLPSARASPESRERGAAPDPHAGRSPISAASAPVPMSCRLRSRTQRCTPGRGAVLPRRSPGWLQAMATATAAAWEHLHCVPALAGARRP